MKKINVRLLSISIISVLMAFYHFYFATIGFIPEMAWRAGHLIFISVLVFLYLPISYKKWGIVLDVILMTLAIIAEVYIILNYNQLAVRMGAPLVMDIIMGTIITIIVIEITRRTLGLPLVIISIVFILYALYGQHLPGTFVGHRGFYYDRIIAKLYLSLDGIHGIPLGVMVKYIYFFILFAGFLEATGAGKWFIDFAFALTGRLRSGPALTAVIGSGFMGSVSGSAVANTVASGSFTIPLMKKVGYKPEYAGAIEAAASTGGQMVPPIMGAGAFIIAEWTGIPYSHIIKVSILPALLYFFSIACYVHIRAIKENIKKIPAEELPSVLPKFMLGIHYLVAILLLVYMIVNGYSPTYSVCFATLALIIVSFVKKESRLTIPKIIDAMVQGGIKSLPVASACAAAGIIVGVVSITGIGLKFSSMVISVAGSNWLLAILLIMLASLFLGMGLPVTAAYVVLAVLAVPGLKELGISLLAAHLVIFWYSQDSNITPPVCLAAYAAAGISGGNATITGLYSWMIAKGIYIIPLLFVYTPILFTGEPYEAFLVTFIAAVGLLSLAIFFENYFITKTNIIERFMSISIVVMCFWNNYYVNYVGLIIFIVMFISQIIKCKSITAQSEAY